jgi:hypothetical protein
MIILTYYPKPTEDDDKSSLSITKLVKERCTPITQSQKGLEEEEPSSLQVGCQRFKGKPRPSD